MIFPVTIIGTGNICTCSKFNGLAGGLEEIDESIVAMVQAGSCPATCMTSVAVGETLIVVFFVLTGIRIRRIPVAGTAFWGVIWAAGVTIVASSRTRVRLRSGLRMAL